MEWADVLANDKCGVAREYEPFRVEIGERYRVYEFGRLVEIVTVNAQNKEGIEQDINDPYDDIHSYELVK